MLKTSTRTQQSMILIMATTILISTIGSVISDFYLSAFSQMSQQLAPHLDKQIAYNLVQLSLTTFFLACAIGGFLTGPLSDQFGRKRFLYWGLCITTLSTFACYQTSNIYFFLVLRIIQGIGASMAAITIRSMFTTLFDEQQLKKISQLFGFIAPILFALTPALGSFLFSLTQNWKSLFQILTLYSLVLIFLCWWCRSSLSDQETPPKESFFKTLLNDFNSIYRHPEYLPNLLILCLTMMIFMAIIVQSPYLFQDYLGFSSKQFAIIQLILGGFWFLSAAINHQLSSRISSTAIIFMGCTLGFSSFIFMLIGAYFSPTSVITLFISFSMFYACMTLIFSNTFLKCIQPFKRQSGSANAILNLCQYLSAMGGSFIIALFSESNQIPLSLLGIIIMFSALCLSLASYLRHQA